MILRWEMKCLSCAFATEENPFHSAAFHPLRPPGDAKGRRLRTMELFSNRRVTCWEWQEDGIYEICFTLWPDRSTAEKPKSRGCAWGGEDNALGAGTQGGRRGVGWKLWHCFRQARSFVAASAQSTASQGVLPSAPIAFACVQPWGKPREREREKARSEFMAVLWVCMFCLTAKTPAISSAVLVFIEMAKTEKATVFVAV